MQTCIRPHSMTLYLVLFSKVILIGKIVVGFSINIFQMHVKLLLVLHYR